MNLGTRSMDQKVQSVIHPMRIPCPNLVISSLPKAQDRRQMSWTLWEAVRVLLPLTKFHKGWCPPPTPTARRCYQRALSRMPF